MELVCRHRLGWSLLFLALLCVVQGLAAKTRKTSLKPYEFALARMGTMFRIVAYDSEQSRAASAATAAFERIEELEAVLSDYREDSEVTSLCRDGNNAPRGVSPELFSVLEQSLRISRLSGGAFDVTVGPVVRLWREARRSGRVPDTDALKKARAAVGYGNVELNPDARTVWLKLPGMQLDFGGIGKGYAADQALALLRERGIACALVDAGGDLTLGASPPGTPGWRIVLRNPDTARGAEPGVMFLHDVGVATSGDAFQYLEVDGRRYSHIVNPGDGMGLRGSAGVTVIAPDGTTADALATALSVMPVADGMRLVESMEGVSAAVVRRSDGVLRRTSSKRFPKAAGVRPALRESATASGRR